MLEGMLNKEIQSNAKLNHPIKAGVLFYPAGSICFPEFFEIRPIEKPLIILFGNKDLFLQMCWKNLVSKLKSPQHPQIYKIYEGANHAFDAYSTRIKCKTYTKSGSIQNPYSELKSQRTYETCNQYNKEAHKESIIDIEKFLINYVK